MHCVLGEALLYEGINVQAQIDPSLTDDHTVRNSGMHLIVYDAFGPVTEHQAPSLVTFVSYMDFERKGVILAYEHLEDEELMDDVKRCTDTHLFGGCPSIVEISLKWLRIWWKLDSLTTQQKHIAFDFLVEFFVDFLQTVRNREWSVRLGA